MFRKFLSRRRKRSIKLLFSSFSSPSSVNAHKKVKREVENDKLKIVGFRVERTEKDPEIDDNGVPILRADTFAVLRLFGFGYKEKTRIGLTVEKAEAGALCNMMIDTGFFGITLESSTNALVNVKMPKHSVDLYFCAATEEVR